MDVEEQDCRQGDMSGSTSKRALEKQPLTEQLYNDEISLFRRYCLKVTGRDSLLGLIGYELAMTLFGSLGGGLGYALRRLFFHRLFKKSGSSMILGKNLTLRHSWNISVGDRLAIDDNVMLDASGAGENGIVIGNDVIISRNATILGKTGSVVIGDRVDFGNNVVLSSVGDVVIEHSVLIAANCYIGGGRYNTERTDIPIMDQGIFSKGPLRIGSGSWLGAGAAVLDGVDIGQGCVVGAGSVVTKNLPDFSVAVGCPAKIVQIRERGI